MCLTCCLFPKKEVFIEARHNRNICLDCYLKGGCLGIGFKKKCKKCQTLWRCEDTIETECCADYNLIAERIIYMGCKCTGNQKNYVTSLQVLAFMKRSPHIKNKFMKE